VSDGQHLLPGGWTSTTLREIAEVVGGLTKDAKKILGPGFREVPYLRVANVQRGRLDLAEVKRIAASESDIQKLSLQPGDVLLNEGGDRDKLGRGWIWQGQLRECIHQNHVFRARLHSRDIDPLYVAHFANSIAQTYFAEHGSQTTNLASISLTKLGSLPIRLPPSQEQKRIVAKLEELLSDLDAGVAELKAAQKKLAQYRQSLLKAAVEGALTADWRAQHTPTETGAQFLERILTERRARWEARQLAKFKEQGKAPPKDWQKKYPEPVQPDITDLPEESELPEGWVWARVAQLGHVQLGRQRSPSKVGKENPTPYIRAANITEGGVDLTDVLEMEFSDTEKETFALKVGDVLLTEASGSPEHVGRPAIWKTTHGLFCFQNTVLRFSPEGIGSDYAFYSFLAMQKLGVFRRLSGGVGINHLSAGKFSALLVPLPPLDEQRALVESIKERLSRCDDQLVVIAYALKQSTAQRQNILRAAFAGQLVPQDPHDEPASVLLARIRAERAGREAVKKPRSGKAKANA
jgi:type I restriction enzyme S subunit